jgi:exodeoxyribonuclease VII small subunit
MADERFTFEQARVRLEEIAAEVRKKDTSLEKSLDLLEEGVRLANICTELVDHTDLGATALAPGAEDSGQDAANDVAEEDSAEAGDKPDDDVPDDDAPDDAPSEDPEAD